MVIPWFFSAMLYAKTKFIRLECLVIFPWSAIRLNQNFNKHYWFRQLAMWNWILSEKLPVLYTITRMNRIDVTDYLSRKEAINDWCFLFFFGASESILIFLRVCQIYFPRRTIGQFSIFNLYQTYISTKGVSQQRSTRFSQTQLKWYNYLHLVDRQSIQFQILEF